MKRWRAALFAILAVATSVDAFAQPRRVLLWHSYRGREEAALDEVVRRIHRDHADLYVESLALPFEALESKLTASIPRGNGPDLFILAHSAIGTFAPAGLLHPLEDSLTSSAAAALLPETLAPLRLDGTLFALPLAFKCLALFYNRTLVAQPPETTDDLIELGRSIQKNHGAFGFAYETGVFYFHAPWFFAFDARLFPRDGALGFATPEGLRSLAFAKHLEESRILPDEASSALITQLFNGGKVAMAMSGPWFESGIAEGISFGVAPLPVVSEAGRRARPFLTSEGVFVSRRARSIDDALRVARLLVGEESAFIRATVGRQPVSSRKAWDRDEIANDPILSAFRMQLGDTVALESGPRMRDAWEPGDVAVRKIWNAHQTPEEAARAAERRYSSLTRAPATSAETTPYLALLMLAALGAVGLFVRWMIGLRREGRIDEAKRSWPWILPAMIATTVLVIVPFSIGLGMAFFDHRAGTWTFVGLANFSEILGSTRRELFAPLGFYYALVVTIAWTAVNLTLHVGFGLFLAILLARPGLALSPIYRVLLIVPWAVPNYITALVWKGLFHKQFGAINALLELFGVRGVAWFSEFGTAFFANVCANVWLGFPFMMVVCLGALQSIPDELYDAADMDGASAVARFRHITLPLLAPSLVPAVLLGSVWTFNQFNIVYLVSGGEPDNATDILVSEAYRWAFSRREQYGYAAAYAALIFVLLFGWSALSARLAKRVEAQS